MRRFAAITLLSLAALSGPLSVPAAACPMCKAANESEPNRPKAYRYSILFMLSMPAVVFTGFGIGFYRLSRRAEPQVLPGDEWTDA